MALAVSRSHDIVDRPVAQIRKGAGGTLTLKASDDGAQIIPTAATITITKPSGGALTTPVVASVVTISGAGVMTYALTAGNADALPAYGDAYAPWKAEWTYTYGGVVTVFVSLFDVVMYPLYNVVTSADLIYHRFDLASSYGGETSAQVYIDQAFEDIYLSFCSSGKRPWLTLDSTVLRRPIEFLALHKYFRARTKGDSDRWALDAKYYYDLYETRMRSLPVTYDLDMTGNANPDEVNRHVGDLGIKL